MVKQIYVTRYELISRALPLQTKNYTLLVFQLRSETKFAPDSINSPKMIHLNIFFVQLDNYTFCDGNKTALCDENQVAEFGEMALSVKTRDGRTPTKDDGKGGQIKKRAQNKMKCRSKRCPIQLRFLKENGDEDEDPDQMVAASKVGQDKIIRRSVC